MQRVRTLNNKAVYVAQASIRSVKILERPCCSKTLNWNLKM